MFPKIKNVKKQVFYKYIKKRKKRFLHLCSRLQHRYCIGVSRRSAVVRSCLSL